MTFTSIQMQLVTGHVPCNELACMPVLQSLACFMVDCLLQVMYTAVHGLSGKGVTRGPQVCRLQMLSQAGCIRLWTA